MEGDLGEEAPSKQTLRWLGHTCQEFMFLFFKKKTSQENHEIQLSRYMNEEKAQENSLRNRLESYIILAGWPTLVNSMNYL